MSVKRAAALLTAIIMSTTIFTGCSDGESTAESKADSSISTEDNVVGNDYVFETSDHQMEIDGKKYQVYDREVRFNYADVPYEEWLSYESPFDEYMIRLPKYDNGIYDNEDIYELEQTVGFAIRYAYENGIEDVEFPIEFGDMTVYYGWEYAGLVFPNIPIASGNCEMTMTDDGYYRIHIAESVLKAASHTEETIAAAKEIVDSIPSDCTTDVDKAYYLYDWVCSNVGYDYFHSDNTGMVNNEPQSAYGALVKKRAVCDGIACAVELLFSMAGIECGKVDANPFSYYDSGHVWNYAVVDGEVWDFDATWDIKNYYYDEGDELTENDPGVYIWFGVERSAKRSYFDISDVCLYLIPPTTDKFTENSPACKAYDYVLGIDENNNEVYSIYNGKREEGTDLKTICQILDEKGMVTLKYDMTNMLLSDFAVLEISDPLLEDIDNDLLIQNIDTDSNFMILAKP